MLDNWAVMPADKEAKWKLCVYQTGRLSAEGGFIMGKMNVEAVKAQMLEDIESLEGECKRLLELIPRYRSDLAKVETEEQAEEFDRTHNLEVEAGLEIIQLF